VIGTVIFDIDGTMYDYEACNRAAMDAMEQYVLKHMGIDGDTFRHTIVKAGQIMKERLGYSCASVHNRLIRIQCMLEELEQPLFPFAQELYHLYWDTVLEKMQPYPGLLEWMSVLKERGISVAVGTNMTALVQYRKLERLGVSSFIDWIVTSEEAGVEKPDRRFFELCRVKSGLASGECLFVGDSPEGDAEGATACGMKALLLNLSSCKEYRTDRGYRTIQSYYECLEENFLESI